ncbi:MAG: peptidylprolyl isomerase [Acidimicrobiia bacterium]|nr:peptidylprolyl isomerase [Acidimicrobiia bacterium]
MPSDKRQRQKEREQAARETRAAAVRRQQKRRTWTTIGGLTVLVFVLAFLFSVLGGDDGGEDAATDTTVEEGVGDTETESPGEITETAEPSDDDEPAAEPVECPAEDGSSEPRLDFPAPPPDCLVEGATYEAVFDTTEGEIRVLLDTEETPQTTNNFVYLARYGYYDDTEIFRSNTGIDILQGGAPHDNSPGDVGPGYTIPDEGAEWTYEPGDLIMARSSLGAGAQFFFGAGPDVSGLDFGGGSSDAGTYVKFGSTVEGVDVLEAILANHVDGVEGTEEGAPDPVPVIDSVTIVQS